jgi:hypothetical protein
MPTGVWQLLILYSKIPQPFIAIISISAERLKEEKLNASIKPPYSSSFF